MPTYQTTGIVIGRTNFGEADRVVRFLTPEQGKLSAVAKGVRRIKSRSGGHLELFGEVNLMLATGRNLDIITSARLMWYPHELTTDYQRLSLAYTMATAIDRLTEPEQTPPGLYQLLREALQALSTGASGALPELWFKLRLVNLLGYRPELSACVTCGAHNADLIYAFSPSRGGITCPSDTTPGDSHMSIAEIKFWRVLSDHSYTTAAQITNAVTTATQTLGLCDAFYEHHLGRSFQPSLVPN